MSPVNRDEFAKLVFGRPGRLRLASWILDSVKEGGFFYQEEARRGTEDVPNEVRTNLEHFQALGLVERAYRDTGPGRRLYYRRSKSPAWQVFRAALHAWSELEAGQRRSDRDTDTA